MGGLIRRRTTLVGLASLALLGACSDKNEIVNVIPAAPTSLSAVPGSDGQTAVVGTALPTPIAVLVMDQFGNAMSNVTVAWTVIGNGGTVSSATSVSGSNGQATVVWTLGPTAGVDSLRASLPSGTSIIIMATATAGAFDHLVLVSGDAQSVLAGTPTAPFFVRAVDANGNAVSGVTVGWTFTGGGTLSSNSSTTDAQGLASTTFTTSITPGPFTVTTTAGTAPAIIFAGNGT